MHQRMTNSPEPAWSQRVRAKHGPMTGSAECGTFAAWQQPRISLALHPGYGAFLLAIRYSPFANGSGWPIPLACSAIQPR
jgi:hypothetical protein